MDKVGGHYLKSNEKLLYSLYLKRSNVRCLNAAPTRENQ